MSAAPTNIPVAAPGKPSLPPTAFAAIGVGAIAVTALILLLVYIPVISLMFAPAPPAVEPVSAGTVRVRESEFNTRINAAAGKIVARSPFHPPVIPEPIEEKPKIYGGPTILGVAGGAVYFNDSSGGSKRIALGETVDEVTVIKINAPWSITLGWRGGEFVVPMLDREPVKFDSTMTVKDMLFQTTPVNNSAADVTRPPSSGSGRPRRN